MEAVVKGGKAKGERRERFTVSDSRAERQKKKRFILVRVTLSPTTGGRQDPFPLCSSSTTPLDATWYLGETADPDRTAIRFLHG